VLCGNPGPQPGLADVEHVATYFVFAVGQHPGGCSSAMSSSTLCHIPGSATGRRSPPRAGSASQAVSRRRSWFHVRSPLPGQVECLGRGRPPSRAAMAAGDQVCWAAITSAKASGSWAGPRRFRNRPNRAAQFLTRAVKSRATPARNSRGPGTRAPGPAQELSGRGQPRGRGLLPVRHSGGWGAR